MSKAGKNKKQRGKRPKRSEIEAIEKRLAATEKNKPGWMQSAFQSTVLAAVVTFIGVMLTLFFNPQTGLIRKTLNLEVKKVQTLHLKDLAGKYDKKKHAVKTIAALYGLDVALCLERPFRSGATIQALTELSKGAASLEQKIVNVALKDVPTIYFIDSIIEGNAYCKSASAVSNTNLDTIYPVIRDLPVRLHLYYGDSDVADPKIILDALDASNPEPHPKLIVLHLGAFAGIEYAGIPAQIGSTDEYPEYDSAKLLAFIAALNKKNYNNEVIVYSRNLGALKTLRSDPTIHKMRSRFIPVKMIRDINKNKPPDEDCFLTNDDKFQPKENGRRVFSAISKIVQPITEPEKNDSDESWVENEAEKEIQSRFDKFYSTCRPAKKLKSKKLIVN